MKCACVSVLLRERQRERVDVTASVWKASLIFRKVWWQFDRGWEDMETNPLMLTVNKRLLPHTNSCLSSLLLSSRFPSTTSPLLFYPKLYCTSWWLDTSFFFLFFVFLTLPKQQQIAGIAKAVWRHHRNATMSDETIVCWLFGNLTWRVMVKRCVQKLQQPVAVSPRSTKRLCILCSQSLQVEYGQIKERQSGNFTQFLQIRRYCFRNSWAFC